MKQLMFSALVFISFPLYAQNVHQLEDKPSAISVPDSPSEVRNEFNPGTPTSSPLRSLAGGPPALALQASPREKRPRVMDRSFALFTLFQFVATASDIESTCYGGSHGLQEANPLVGSHPSRGKLYGISMPVTTGLALWSYKLKKAAPHRRLWMVVPSVGVSIHAGATINNLVRSRR